MLDWWTTPDSEPSLASSTPLQGYAAMYRGPEFAHSAVELDGPYININKGDYNKEALQLFHCQTCFWQYFKIKQIIQSAGRPVRQPVNH